MAVGLGAIRLPQADEPEEDYEPMTVDLDEGNPVDTSKGMEVETPTGDGGVIVRIGPPAKPKKDTSFDANLAEEMPDSDLGQIADQLLRLIDEDDQSRREWLDTRAKGIKLMGLKIEEMRSSGADGSAPLEGMSQMRATLLCEAVVRFGANAFAELCPSDGPAKVTTTGSTTDETTDDLAQALEADLNDYLLDVDKPWVPDTDAALLRTGLDGCVFKKVYHDPILRRPVSRAVYGEDLIVNNSATSVFDARRITHRSFQSKGEIIRMQIVEAYRDVELGDPGYAMKSPPEIESEQVGGVRKNEGFEQEDRSYEIFETYCELDLPGFEHEGKNGKPDGLPLPYKVVIAKEARVILEIRRNWRDGDDMFLPKLHFVQYPFIRGFGFYSIGLSHLLGNITNGLTAAYREFIDSGMFNNFPGGLIDKSANRQNTSLIRSAPGQFASIETGGRKIGDVVSPYPYKPLDAVFVQFMQTIEQTGQRLGGTAEVMVGEGRQDAPVGTTLALIEQAIKPLLATHKRLCGAQGDELQLLVQRFREDPGAFMRGRNPDIASRWDEDTFLAAINSRKIVPRADPNTASHLQRMLRNAALYQMAKDDPPSFNVTRIRMACIRGIGFSDPAQYLNPNPQGPPPDPKAEAAQLSAQADFIDSQTKAKQLAFQQQNSATEDQNRDQDRKAKLAIAGAQLKREQLIQQGESLRAAHADRSDQSQQAMELRQKSVENAKDRMHEALQNTQDRGHEAALAGQEQAHQMRQVAAQAALKPPAQERASGGRAQQTALTKEQREHIYGDPDEQPSTGNTDSMYTEGYGRLGIKPG